MANSDEREALALFTQRYGLARTDVTAAVERAVIGADFGANGFTTRAQADDLARDLELAPGKRLLDVGAGRGWPGVYLALRTGCEVVLSDLPWEGLRLARQRAEREGLGRRVAAVVSSARDVPFRPEQFDAVVHTDVLC